MNQESKKCSCCGIVKPMSSFANKWKKKRPSVHWDPRLADKITKTYRNGETQENDPYCKDCCKKFGIRNTSRFTIQEQIWIIEASKLEMQETSDLYWIHLAEHTDPSTEGYVGIGVPNSRPTSSMKGLAEQFGIDEKSIKLTTLKRGVKTEIVLDEMKYRPHDGIGWNYQKGGSVGNGAGSPGVCRAYLESKGIDVDKITEQYLIDKGIIDDSNQ